MNRIDTFNLNMEKIKYKFDNNIQLENMNVEYIKCRDKVNWICKKHNIVFQSTIHILTDKRITCGCPICKQEKLYTSSIKGVEVKKQLKDIK